MQKFPALCARHVVCAGIVSSFGRRVFPTHTHPPRQRLDNRANERYQHTPRAPHTRREIFALGIFTCSHHLPHSIISAVHWSTNKTLHDLSRSRVFRSSHHLLEYQSVFSALLLAVVPYIIRSCLCRMHDILYIRLLFSSFSYFAFLSDCQTWAREAWSPCTYGGGIHWFSILSSRSYLCAFTHTGAPSITTAQRELQVTQRSITGRVEQVSPTCTYIEHCLSRVFSLIETLNWLANLETIKAT